ncbi:hypothetical protein, partial [Thiolapillus sp.]|uniref:hypothetical protein n=1 Tax=Thiolapillus sp. TaxID=2017437 RepID=UPI003AF44157
GFPHVHPARDGGVKSTGCPHGVRSSMAKKGLFYPQISLKSLNFLQKLALKLPKFTNLFTSCRQ